MSDNKVLARCIRFLGQGGSHDRAVKAWPSSVSVGDERILKKCRRAAPVWATVGGNRLTSRSSSALDVDHGSFSVTNQTRNQEKRVSCLFQDYKITRMIRITNREALNTEKTQRVSHVS